MAGIPITDTQGFGIPTKGNDHADAAKFLAYMHSKERVQAMWTLSRQIPANTTFVSVGLLTLRSPAVFPGRAALFVIFFPDNTVAGRRVHFVERDPRVLAGVPPGSRIAALLIGPEGAPPCRSVRPPGSAACARASTPPGGATRAVARSGRASA